VKSAGKPVLTVDYVDDGTGYVGENRERIDEYLEKALEKGYTPYAALWDRELDELNLIDGVQPRQATRATAQVTKTTTIYVTETEWTTKTKTVTASLPPTATATTSLTRRAQEETDPRLNAILLGVGAILGACITLLVTRIEERRKRRATTS